MEFLAPPAPTFAPDHESTTTSALRYEDLAQDGRMIPIALPHALAGLWRDVLSRDRNAQAARSSGVIPLLTRLVLTSTAQPIRVDRAIETRAGFELAHSRAANGDVAKIYLNAWGEVRGAAGSLFPPRGPGELALAGQLFAEHTFTRPFAPPDQRRVTRLEAAGHPDVPPARHDAPPPATSGEAPAGATWTSELLADPAESIFTLDQTDSNQHVNSLVYVRIFLDGVQRLLATTQRPLRVRSRAVDIAYRKPCFAGDRVRVHARFFDHQGRLGAAGHVATDGDDRPRCFVRVWLDT